MKRTPMFIIALALSVAGHESFAAAGAGGPATAALDPYEDAQLVYQREAEKLARDVYLWSYDLWGESVFYNTEQAEQRHMDTMLKMLDMFGIEDPVGSNGMGVFADADLDALYPQLIDRAGDSELEAFQVGALLEETEIMILREALAGTDEPALINAYGHLLAASRNHLRVFVSHVEALGEDYQAQALEQSDVDALTEDYTLMSGQGATISNGFSGAWYYPATPGQGFFIIVYTEVQAIFLGWFTYDTERPAEEVQANLGDPGHRWITAYGTYDGALAELDIEITTGGVFDSEQPLPTQSADGTILLQFENCMNGTVVYDIPSVGTQSIVPIARISPEEVNCQQQPTARGRLGAPPAKP